MGEAINPILGGFYPDPSVCRVGEDYYLVTSTFAYTPGVPVFHSRDLVNWKQIGHVLERKEQLNLDGAGMSEGIYAPCIRYWNDIYYMITTNVSCGGNFYVTAEKPEGPWSDPVYLREAEGIDPSLFFDNGKCYYVGQRTKKDAGYFGDCEIWLQELDLEKKRLTGKIHILWDGALKHAVWAEGPHLYKRNDYYYLLIAEGGTEYGHSICIARSRELFGQYEGCPFNPIFTHRHLGHHAGIQNTGHGDLIETPDGQWYIVMLGTRPIEGYAPLGRETFIADVSWENDWPVVNSGEGKLRVKQKIHLPAEESSFISLKNRYLFFRYPERDMYKICEDGRIMVKALSRKFEDKVSPAYMGLRITSHGFGIRTYLEFEPSGNQEAGIVYLYDEKHYIKFVIMLEESGYAIKTIKVMNEKEVILSAYKTSKIKHELRMYLDELKLTCAASGEKVLEAFDVRELTAEAAGGFVGCTMGIYASSNTDTHNNERYACFSEPEIIKQPL